MGERTATVLAVGATGSIGRHVVVEALREGYAVRALVRDIGQAGRFPLAAEVVAGDLTRADTLARAGAGNHADHEPFRHECKAG